jgi:cytochrome P450
MLDREPPDHTRLRRLVLKAFTPCRVAQLRPTVQRIVDGVVDDLLAAGGGDLIATVAEPLTVTVVADTLGVDGAAGLLNNVCKTDMPRLQPSAVTAVFQGGGRVPAG